MPLDAAPPRQDVRDFITLLTTKGPRATKLRRPGEVKDYDKAKWFSIREAAVSNVYELAEILESLGPQTRTLTVRGKPAEGINRSRTRRNGSALLPAAHHWLLLDFDELDCPAWLDPLDDPDHTVEYVVSHLPREFHAATCWWQYTAGQEFKPGINIRLGFWLDRQLADQQLKRWLTGAPVDHRIFAPVQAIYVARPLFDDGVPDPVPVRSGVWRGDRDEVSAPVLPETPPPAARSEEWVPAAPTRGGFAGLAASLGGYANHRARIGNHQEGGSGFYEPLQKAIGSYFRQHGADGDVAWLRADLEAAIRTAVSNHDDAYIEKRVRDLPGWIGWNQQRQRESEQREAEAAAEAAPEPEPEPIAPTYAAPLGSADEARAALTVQLQAFTVTARAYSAMADKPDPPPAVGVAGTVGIGKSQTTRKEVIEPLIAAELPTVYSVPQHKLGDEFVLDLVRDGTTAMVYRGRDADDPSAPGEKMCREHERTTAIFLAGGDVEKNACRHGEHQCEFFDVCGYRKQQQATPQTWVPKPRFIPQPAALVIDEGFANAFLHGTDKPVILDLSGLLGDRSVPGSKSNATPPSGGLGESKRRRRSGATKPTRRRSIFATAMFATADLHDISSRVYNAILASDDGWVRRETLLKARLTADDLHNAHKLEWRRKLDLDDVLPGMPRAEALGLCKRINRHNGRVPLLARFWRLLAALLDGEAERSPYVYFERRAPLGDEDIGPGVRMIWRRDIHPSWKAPTLLLDATLQPAVARVFFPQMAEPVPIDAPMPHTRVRQITDQPLSHAKFVHSDKASEHRNNSRHNNVERLRRLIEVRANDVWPRPGVVITQKNIEKALKAGPLPANIEVTHYNAIRGLNRWSKVGLLIIIGRTEPPVRSVEQIARALFGADVQEVAASAKGEQYPQVTRAIRMRDGTGYPVTGNQHPDPRAEAIRWSIAEAELVHAIGRARGVNRTADNPLQVDILTSVCIPGIEVDETTTWASIQPSCADVMRARGAVPLVYADMATAYPDLFSSGRAAETALHRENPTQTSIGRFLIDKCVGFRSCQYRRRGATGPRAQLLYDPSRIDPAGWLAERLGEVILYPEPAASDPVAAAADPVAPAPIGACPCR